jgi:hypothetical protein
MAKQGEKQVVKKTPYKPSPDIVFSDGKTAKQGLDEMKQGWGKWQASVDSAVNGAKRVVQQMEKEERDANVSRAKGAMDSRINPVSNSNQSNPGSTSGGFSYKLKND